MKGELNLTGAGKPQPSSLQDIIGSNAMGEMNDVQGGQPETVAVAEVQNEGLAGEEMAAKSEGNVVESEVGKEIGLSDDELKRIYEERFGVKEKEQTKEETEEQKSLRESEFEKRMVDLWVAQGGKLEDYVELKKISNSDLTELSKSELTAELKEKGFSDDEILEIQMERYYQLNPDEIEQGLDESDEEYEARKEKIRKKVQYGTEKLTTKGKYQQERAKSIIEGLKKAVQMVEERAKSDSQYTAEVEKLSNDLPRKMTVQLGKLNDTELSPIDIEVPTEAVEMVVAQLKDRDSFEQQYFKDDGSINVQKFAEVLLRNATLEKAAREAYLHGRTEQVRKFEEVFPAKTAQELGVGGNAKPVLKGGKAVMVGKGKTEVMNSADYRVYKK